MEEDFTIKMLDLSKIIKDENKRQALIKEQLGDGKYNPLTGVYKWGANVYDLTETNGEIGFGWLLPWVGELLLKK